MTKLKYAVNDMDKYVIYPYKKVLTDNSWKKNETVDIVFFFFISLKEKGQYLEILADLA